MIASPLVFPVHNSRNHHRQAPSRDFATMELTLSARNSLLADQNASGTTFAQIEISSEVEIVAARQIGRAMAVSAGFTSAAAVLIATAISELARNIVVYADRGEIILQVIENGDRRGIKIVAADDGPGIDDVDQAMQLGYSTSGGLGLGLPGVKKLMDDFEIASTRSTGTRVTVVKWKF